MSILRAQSVTKLFGRRAAEARRKLEAGAGPEEIRALGVTAAVVDATFAVEQGEIFVVMGLSGSGKSTLIRMLNGLLEPTSGKVEIEGQDIARLGGKALRTLRQNKISMVFQHDAKKDIVVTLWRPHWAYAKFPIRDLADPKGAMGQPDGVNVVAREGFSKDQAEVAGWLKKFRMDDKQLGTLEDLMENKYKGKPEQAVNEWVQANPDFAKNITG